MTNILDCHSPADAIAYAEQALQRAKEAIERGDVYAAQDAADEVRLGIAYVHGWCASDEQNVAVGG